MRQLGSEFVAFVSKFFVEIGPEGRWLYFAVENTAFYSLILLTLLSFLSDLRPGFGQKSKTLNIIQARWVFSLILFVFVVMSKFPTAMIGHLNPDEELWIACAKTMMQDPRPWLECDTSTSGPLVILPLIVLKFFGIPIDVGSTRLASGIVFALSVVFAFQAYTNIFGKSLGRLAIIPLSAALGLGTSFFWDFIPYNGEQVPVLLLSLSFLLLSKVYISDSSRPWPIFLLGIVLGVVPFAKLQAVPIALFITLITFVILFKRKSIHIWLFTLSGILPFILIIVWITLAGDIGHFWNSYILFNFFYVNMETPEGTTLFTKLILAWDMLFEVINVSFYFQSSLIICLFSLLFLNIRNAFKNKRATSVLVFSLFYFIVTLYCIGQPYRHFVHYTIFAFLSMNLLMASFLFAFVQSHSHFSLPKIRNLIPYTVLLSISVIYFYQVFSFHPPFFGHSDQHQNGYGHNLEVAAVINKYTHSGDRLAVWGWNGTFYSDTDLIMGSRFADTAGIIVPNPHNAYLMDVYIGDLTRNTPRIFLDAIKAGERFYDRNVYGFENFPKLRVYIEENYKLAEDIQGFRVYVRNGTN